jgi:hypothetical protein
MRIVLVVTLAALLTAGAGASLYRQHVDSPEFAVQQAWIALALRNADAFQEYVDLRDLVRGGLSDGRRAATGNAVARDADPSSRQVDAMVAAVSDLILHYVAKRQLRTSSEQIPPRVQAAIERALGKNAPEFRGVREIRCSESQAQVELDLFWPEPKETVHVALGLRRQNRRWKVTEIRNLPALAQFLDRQLERDPVYGRAIRSAKARHCIANLKQIEAAKEMWIMDTNAGPDAFPTAADLYGPTRYIRRAPVCPQGGTYTIGNGSTRPTCSIGRNGTPDDREDDHRLDAVP